MVLKLPGAMGTNNKYGRCLKKLSPLYDVDDLFSAKIPTNFLTIIK